MKFHQSANLAIALTEQAQADKIQHAVDAAEHLAYLKKRFVMTNMLHRYTLLKDGTIVTEHDIVNTTDWITSWWCSPRYGCPAVDDGIKCPCGRWRRDHDPGDEDKEP